MTNYCAVPPFLSRVLPPNVMIILDNSGSMFNFAYNYRGEDVSYGFDSAKKYYGYFNPDYWYKYENGKFIATAKKDSRSKEDDEWDGNFLNWLTMRRIDIARKVLTGGKYVNGYLVGEEADGKGRGYIKRVDNAEYYTPYTGTIDFTFDLGSGGVSKFEVCHREMRRWGWGEICEEYNVKIQVSARPVGVIQKIGNKVRWGLAFYHVNIYDNGGYISVPISYNNTSELVEKINEKRPDSNTPLAETLWTVVGYFAQKDKMLNGPGPRYQEGDYQIDTSVDPYNYGTADNPVMAWCAKSFVIYITDGEPCGDDELPEGLKNYAENNGGCSYDGSLPTCRAGGNKPWVQDVALYAHTNDLRSDLRGNQTLTIYTIFAFGEGSGLLNCTAINGGFEDINRDGKPSSREEWDRNGDGVPDNYFVASNGYELEEALENVLTDILRRASSGTAVSVLSEKSQMEMFAYQAVFYPEKTLSVGRKITWTGYLYTWWLFNSMLCQNIREDTKNDKILELAYDRVLDWKLDSSGHLKIVAYLTNEDGCTNSTAGGIVTYNSFDETHPLIEAGSKLASEGPADRKIYTVSSKNELVEFTVANKSKFSQYLGNSDNFPYCLISQVSNKDERVNKLIEFIRGNDVGKCRSRKIDDAGHTWKLGDIIYSTPAAAEYGNYTVVFVGANDGMLHAFKVGYLKKGFFSPTKLCEDKNSCGDTTLGKELWAFIPKNALPYLRYLMDPNYCHIYYVDLPPYLILVNGKRILIGGMRFGGGTSVVHPPEDTCPDVNSENCTGLSSYFALDVTDPENPKFLWEFTDPHLGFAYSGPAHITYRGKHFILFASGPTNYDGTSDQDLRFFVLELDGDGKIAGKYVIDKNVASTLASFKNAFGGRLFTEGIDYNEDGNTDMVFVGVSYCTGSEWQGNVIGIGINGDDPTRWDYVKVFNSAIKPVTAKIEHMKCFDMHYIYFGTGRWFFKTDDEGQNQNDRERLYGVRIDGCYDDMAHCNVNVAHNAEGVCNELIGDRRVTAWYVELDPKEEGYMKERDIADPTVSVQDVIFFTTIQPTDDICGFGGRSRMWGLNCATGGNSTSGCPGGKYKTKGFKGTLFLQLSGGNVEPITQKTFTKKRGRATPWYKGIAPETATPLVSPVGKKGTLILWLER